jgi:hypothetical protein
VSDRDPDCQQDRVLLGQGRTSRRPRTAETGW